MVTRTGSKSRARKISSNLLSANVLMEAHNNPIESSDPMAPIQQVDLSEILERRHVRYETRAA